MKRVHLIGICGTGMAALAAMLKVCGFEVIGSDSAVYPPMSNFLKEQGITPTFGYRAENVEDDLDLVIVGNAISRGNPELEEVLNLKIRYASLPEILFFIVNLPLLMNTKMYAEKLKINSQLYFLKKVL